MSTSHSLTREQVMEAQTRWADGIVRIGADFIEKRDYVQTAREHINSLYAYDISPVLFKPTKAVDQQFRGDKESALSYFVASNGHCSEDKGFAIQPWTKVKFENSGIVIRGDTALAMGNYYFTDTEGQDTMVEYSFGYIPDEKGALRIVLHHSSLPFSG